MNSDKKKHIDNIHKDIIPKKTGFNIPEDFLENIEDSVLNVIILQKNIKESGFKIPIDYFNTIEEKIEFKLSKNSKPKIINFNSPWIKFSVAAAVLFTISILYLNNYITTNPRITTEKMFELRLANMSADELALLYEYELDDIDTSGILSSEELNQYLETNVYDLYYIDL